MPAVALAEAEGPGTEFTAGEFTIEETPPEEELEAESEAASTEALAADALQMLIEDLSGITSALRKAAPQGTGNASADGAAGTTSPAPLLSETPPGARIDAVSADPAGTGTAEAPVRPAFPGLPDMAPEMPAEGAAIEAVTADMPLPDAKALPPDPAGPLPAPLRPDAALPPDARMARAAVVPVARQIAEAVVTARDDLVEIALAPEELGRIRMVVTGPEHHPHVTVWVERPEVLDQLRRNAAVLQECLGDAGMPEASFEFQGDTPSDSRRDRGASAAPSSPFEAAEPARSIPVAWTPTAVPARLDIRI